MIHLSYFLKLFDDNLIEFTMEKSIDGIDVELLWFDENKTDMLPLGVEPTDASLK